MDRNRLSKIQQSDLTESRVNQEFVDWLKTKGLNYALVFMVALCAVMGWNLWKQRQARVRNDAWQDLAQATLPAAFEDVAARFREVDGVAPLALLSAADRYLQSVQTGVRFDRSSDAEDYRLTPETRGEFLDTADRLYAEVLGLSSTGDARLGFQISACFGRAAVNESKGQSDEARGYLEQASSKAEAAGFPQLVEVAQQRIATLGEIKDPVVLPTQAELPAPPSVDPATAPIIDDALIRDLLTPSATPATSTTNVAPPPTTTPTAPPTAPPATVPPTTDPSTSGKDGAGSAKGGGSSSSGGE